jgi:hypothetical protein
MDDDTLSSVEEMEEVAEEEDLVRRVYHRLAGAGEVVGRGGSL